MKPYKRQVLLVVIIKFLGTAAQLLVPYVLEYMIDTVAPGGSRGAVLLCGFVMVILALLSRDLNVFANRRAANIAGSSAYRLRQDLFRRTVTLSGSQVDAFGLPSLTSRMTSDSYNVQNFIRFIQALGIRAPILLLGGIIITLTMDPGLSAILCISTPIMLLAVIAISRKGIPLYDRVQEKMDRVVRVMRENIAGIRVVKALSKEDHEEERFSRENRDMTRAEQQAGATMALPGPLMTLTLNLGLILVVLFGARRVNSGVTEPGVILAFLTYFNMILMGVLGLNRLFIMLSKANASANRIAAVLAQGDELPLLPESEAEKPENKDFIVFDHVSFRYGRENPLADAKGFVGGKRQHMLEDVSFTLKKGHTLGIIGPTGCGKTTIVNLLMRFYDPNEGHIYLDGKDLRCYDLRELRKKFGSVFQNGAVFADTLRENISFGRELTEADLQRAAEDACATEFIRDYEEGLDYRTAIRGADLSGGQKQRILISRALAGDPEVLILDDASSALDYRTDSALRKSIRENHRNTTVIMIAQRISSILNMDEILVLDEGRIIGRGSHEELMQSCPKYREIYEVQMGEAK